MGWTTRDSRPRAPCGSPSGPLAARTVTAQALETGGAGLAGRLGDGAGKWRLDVSADQPVQVMNLLRSPSGSLTNLSTRTVPEPDLSIHFVGCAAPEGFHGYLARGAREAGEDLGVDLTYVYPEVHTAASQVRLIDDAITAEADGIAVCAFANDDEYRDVASRARGAGIAFGSAAAPPPGSVMRNPDDPFLFRTGADERAAGALTARRLLAMGVRGRVVILNHLPDDVTCGHRAASQREVLEKHGVKVALVERDMDASQQSYALLAQLRGYPDTTHAATSVCAAPDPLLLVKALTGRDDLVITGYDLLGETLAAIRDGRQAFAIDQQQFWRGYVPVMLLTHYLRYGAAAGELLPDRSEHRRRLERGAGGRAGGPGVSLTARPAKAAAGGGERGKRPPAVTEAPVRSLAAREGDLEERVARRSRRGCGPATRYAAHGPGADRRDRVRRGQPGRLVAPLPHARALGLRDEDLVPGELNASLAGGGVQRLLKRQGLRRSRLRAGARARRR